MTSITVTNVASDVTEKQLKDFFSFCGKLSSLEMHQDGTNQKAKITFERQSAAKTALLLQDAQLGSSKIKVSADSSVEGADSHDNTATGLSQEDKPRTAIIAEYLSHGYVLGDTAVQKSIDFDHQHGVSARFTSFLNSMDDKFGVTERSKAVDDKYKVTEKGQGAVDRIHTYFEAALDTPTGKKVRDFYTSGQKNILDIHNEARRLADSRQGKEGPTTISVEESSGSQEKKAETGQFGAIA